MEKVGSERQESPETLLFDMQVEDIEVCLSCCLTVLDEAPPFDSLPRSKQRDVIRILTTVDKLWKMKLALHPEYAKAYKNLMAQYDHIKR